jgi:Pro-kumamolisin, activation domain/Bacterial Ig-like domain (group 3)
MKLHALLVRTSALLCLSLLFVGTPRVAAQSNTQATSQSSFVQAPTLAARITQAIDETQFVRLSGNVHPLARREFDQGPVPDSTPMRRMLLVLQRSPEQEAALETLLGEQQVKDSPNYHNWLTPQQFGVQFGPADADIQTVTGWLSGQGFQGIKVAAGRTVIEFSGTAGQVRNAFHTEIHHYLVNGQTRQANSTDPQIPAALTPVVAGIVTLHNFPRKSMKRVAGAFVQTKEGIAKPFFTTTSGCGSGGAQPCYVVGPADFAKIYNVPNGLSGTPTTLLDGTGVTIALVEDSNINAQDVIDFRNLFGLPANFTQANIILNGPDPGPTSDEGEADLDVQVAGMVAPGATTNLVVSEDTLTVAGIDLSAVYIVDNNIAPVMSESFGVCEPALGTAGNRFYNAIWEQAAAQGISVMVSAGDNGSAGCDDFTTAKTATNGLAVSGIASTPFDVAVGGTDFDDVGTQTTFWSSTNVTGSRESARGYIPEIPWNDSCAASSTSSTLNTVCATANNIVGGSGGPSSVYAKPPFQSGTITPNDNHRDLPDLSLFASDGASSNSFYLACQADAISAGKPPSCVPDSQGHFSFLGVGGTSASSPAFAGIMALIDQQQNGRQGNPNLVLYTIAKTPSNFCDSSTQPLSPAATCIFYDITKGNNSVPCMGGSPNCSSTSGTNGVLVSPSSTTTPAWMAGTGYDTATGLGSVNVTNLAALWKIAVGAFKASTTSLTINGSANPGTIAHGTQITAAVTVAANPGPGTPTGDVALLAATSVNGSVSDGTLANGTASIQTTFLPGGTYNVTAHYAGDGTFAPSDSAGIPVTVTKENSSLLAEMITFDALGNVTSTNATSFAYGSGPILRVDILNHTATAGNCQPLVANGVITGCAIDATGSVTITDNGSSLPGSPFMINSVGHLEDQTIQLTGGPHTLALNYPGDISYNASPAVTLNLTVTPAATAASVSANPNPVLPNQQVTLSVTIGSQSNSTQGPTGTVTFKDGSTTIGTANVTPAGATATVGASGTAVLTTTFATTSNHSLTAAYAGDTNYAASTSSAFSLSVGQTTATTLTGSPTSISSGGSVTLTATVVANGTGATPTGTVQFMSGTTALGTAQTCTAVSGATAPTCSATLMTTLALLTPPAGPNRIPTLRVLPWVLPASFVLLVLLLLGLKRVPRPYRRVYACASLLLLAGLVAGLAAGCGSGSGGGGGPHFANITAVYGGDTTYAGSTSSAITITVQ